MKKLYIISFMALLALMAASCGSATAPPVDLPAPVVGRITVGTPDASGKSLITGTAGAVTGDSIVMAINENLTTASILWEISDHIIPAAHAQLASELPTICSEAGHFCTVAASDGSFEMTIDASIGDNIIIVLVDEYGNEISDRVSFIIPSTSLDISLCGEYEVDGSMVDLFNRGTETVQLYEGNGDSSNTVAAGSLSIKIPGCFAKSMTLIPESTLGPSRAVVMSDLDAIIWSVDVVGGTALRNPRTYQLEDIPLGVAYIGDPDRVAIVLDTVSGFKIARFSLVDGTIDATIGIPELAPGYTPETVLGIRSIGPFTNSGGFLGVIMFRAKDAALNVKHYALFFETLNFKNPTGSVVDVDLVLSPAVFEDVADFTLAFNTLADLDFILMFSDTTNNLLRITWVVESGTTTPINLGDSLAAIRPTLYRPVATTDPNPGAGIIPGKIGMGYNNITTAAYVLIDDASNTYNLWSIGNYFLPSTDSDLILVPVENPTMISLEREYKSIAFGNEAGDIATAYDLWWTP